ncbi:hypothetical protein QZH41_020286 [Actinostola sp. cb2023]|nr:hypothetical protein QZH41_020286 [Actinostola sp. cb2023]
MYPSHLSLVGSGRTGIGHSEGPAVLLMGEWKVVPVITCNRPHQGVTLPNAMMPNPMYPQYVFSETPRGYPLPFPHAGFPQPLQSGIRPPHTQTTATMQGMHILDHQSFFAAAAATNTALRNLGAGNMTADALGSITMMDSSAANPGIYSMQIGMQQAPNLQVAVSAGNPNATSPRPSILRKRTSEGLRKATVVPYNNDVPPPITSEPAASPRSDSTLSAPQSGQSSPKPPSVVTEDKYGSSVPLEEASSDDDEKKAKPQVEDTMDDDLKFILHKRPKISIFGGYKVNTKAAHNHFLKYSDVKIKEERKPTVQDIANQKGIVHRVSGWRVHHVAAQMDDLSSVEQQVLQKLFEFRENLPKPRPGQKSKYHDELMMLDELVQVSYHYPCGMALITGSTSTTNVSLLVIV